MADLPHSDIMRRITAANEARSGAPATIRSADAERQLEAYFRVSHALAVYGTLAPGRPSAPRSRR